jgi:MFS family permease
MGLNILQAASHRPTFFYGWVIVTIAFFVAFLIAGSGSTFGVFVIPMSDEFHWSRSIISVAAFFSTLVSGLCQPFLGHLYDRFGGRKVILVSLVLQGLCTTILSLTFHIVFLILIYGVVMSIFRGGGATSWIIARWFRRKRATALALGIAGSSLGTMAAVPVAAYLIDLAGWRLTWVALGIIILVLALPLALFLRDDPSDVGLLPDGDPEPSGDSDQTSGAQAVRGPLEADHWSQSFRSLPIWQFSGAYWACGFITGMIFIHFIPYAEGAGFSRATAARAFGLMIGLNFVGLLVTGLLSDRFGRKNVLASIYAMRVLAFGLLLAAPGAWGLWGFTVIMGLSWYASAPLTNSLTADIYGLKTLGVLNGITFLAHQVGGSLSVLLGGIIYDVTGSYGIPFAISGMLMVWASVAAFSVNERKYSTKYQVSGTLPGSAATTA